MCLRLATVLFGVLVIFSLAGRVSAVAAAPCHQGVELANTGEHLHSIEHAAGNEGDSATPADSAGDCCESDARCDSQSCSGGAALPCVDAGFQLPPAAGQLPSAPAESVVPGCTRLQRPPIFA